MARLIDAKVYCMELYNEMNYPGRSGEFMTAIDVAIADLADAPTVDAVEVVRCKDCKWLYDEMDDYCCRSHRGLVRICENSFCSYGERKDGDGNG